PLSEVQVGPAAAAVTAPASVDLKTPTSLPMYRSCGLTGSTTMAFTGASARLPLMSVHAAPAFVVFQTWPWPNPETVTNAVFASVGWTAMLVMLRSGRPTVRLVQLPTAPP